MDDRLAATSDCQLEQIAGFLPISDRLGTAGQPKSDAYPAIAAAGYQVVINLALTDSPNALPNEAEIASNLGLEYLHIPVIWDNPTLADFQAFANAMEAHRSQKIFVHCAANKRVSVFVYLYRLSQGVAETIARQDLAKIWTPNEIWQTFIETIAPDYLHKN
ncbi:protein tyrosine phosphatase family protein [Chamaesiphon sp. VAR_69_metabat_338]|uniref:protein tyrosine phosphatase family protein n=1 Tax=Chamaesiphon sp. VAR_69_metabat_338 TaxID=2964704 RepID=UPI00286E58B1|nr:protein tyrosine phosphatase family protein [Chamaesiphon sp. VAR_69_metabat_338]